LVYAEGRGQDQYNAVGSVRSGVQQLGIIMIPAYSPEARGRSERMFRTHQYRLTKKLAVHHITGMEDANRYIKKTYLPAYNKEFKQKPPEEGAAFIPWVGAHIEDILCEYHERTATPDNCVAFDGITLQIPTDKYRCHYVRARVNVHRYMDGSLAIFHGPRKVADYDQNGHLKLKEKRQGSVSPPLAETEGKGRKKMPFAPFLKHSEKRTYHVLQNRTAFYLLLTTERRGLVVGGSLVYKDLVKRLKIW